MFSARYALRTGHFVGWKFDRLQVVSRVGTDESGNSTWLCKCSCGKEKVVDAQSLCSGRTKSCGCLRLEGRKARNRVGEKFGKLSITQRVKGGWLCLCECGAPTKIWDSNWGVTQSCGCLRIKLPSGQATRNAVLRQYKKDAAYRNLSWSLSDEEFDRLMEGNCAYCGRGPSNLAVADDCNGDFRYNGIDRKDNPVGYESWNVVSCCALCNRMKHTLTVKEFLAQIEEIAGFQQLSV
jgi:hypothetical protein